MSGIIKDHMACLRGAATGGAEKMFILGSPVAPLC
jgi:hypothetical protein